MHANDDVFDPFGNCHATQFAGELTLADMGVIKDTGAKHAPARTDNLPAVGEMVPAGIYMLNSHLELIARFTQFDDTGIYHLRRIRSGRQ
jgi:hypothetical protein